jgi:prepilin-type N-terminal cleavage/methylation domain-containing protein
LCLGVFVVKRNKIKFFVSSCLCGGKGFTLVELVVAIGIMALVILFAGNVFKTSINSYRIASAHADIMQKFRAITNQLNNNFQGLQKDGYLMLYSENLPNRTEYFGATPRPLTRSDRLYFFSTGDFQSWYDPTIRSNIARIYLGHDKTSLDVIQNVLVNHWRLAHDILLLSPGVVLPDVNSVSFAEYRVNSIMVLNDANLMLSSPPDINIAYDPNTLRRLFCENAGEFKIEWSDGAIDANSAIAWFGLGLTRTVGAPPAIPPDARYNSIESGVLGSYYKATWQPLISAGLWPKALKFTFTLYDSRGVFKDGQTFTHIVYIGD